MINIVLYQPEIPQNTGNIMRTCAGTNTKLHLIKPLGFRLDEKSIKRSGVNYLPFCEYEVYENYEDFLSKNKGDFYYFTRYSKKSYATCNYSNSKSNIYLIFGRESTGIPKEILHENLDKCVRIPMNDNIRALNLSNSVAIALFEVLRQQDFPNLLVKEPFKGENYIYD
ncbi:MAG: tRNA (cytidine(34)-2'-O)-methyltransferase [Clostridium sp.]|nr:tRNA (cytidine(34)-2'-O)-methyltransferase [Clostridium sp.]MCM1443693.1 tRNA (cytidine(34)-2'-O)-methyltransferase [Candidatus Amulumruptor caecigallinarius]